eukprot:484895-Hanusia_phi.AAC.2
MLSGMCGVYPAAVRLSPGSTRAVTAPEELRSNQGISTDLTAESRLSLSSFSKPQYFLKLPII